MTDDTAAIQAAFDYQQGGGDDSGLAATPAIVYLPPGTYLISDTLVLWFYSHLLGNALCPPTLLLAPSTPGFSGAYGLRPMVTANLGFNISVRHHAWWIQAKYLGGQFTTLICASYLVMRALWAFCGPWRSKPPCAPLPLT